jgi:hypothetical protein
MLAPWSDEARYVYFGGSLFRADLYGVSQKASSGVI